jgi:hypothetical protein
VRILNPLRRWFRGRTLRREWHRLERVCEAAGEVELAACLRELWRLRQRGAQLDGPADAERSLN